MALPSGAGHDAALALLDRHAEEARIVAGGTDVLVELSRGVKRMETLIDIAALGNLNYIQQDETSCRLCSSWTTPMGRMARAAWRRWR